MYLLCPLYTKFSIYKGLRGVLVGSELELVVIAQELLGNALKLLNDVTQLFLYFRLSAKTFLSLMFKYYLQNQEQFCLSNLIRKVNTTYLKKLLTNLLYITIN